MNEKAKIRYYQTTPLNVPISHIKNNQTPLPKSTHTLTSKKNKHFPQKISKLLNLKKITTKNPLLLLNQKHPYHTQKKFFIHTNPNYPHVKNERSPFQWAFYFKFALNFFLPEKQIP